MHLKVRGCDLHKNVKSADRRMRLSLKFGVPSSEIHKGMHLSHLKTWISWTSNEEEQVVFLFLRWRHCFVISPITTSSCFRKTTSFFQRFQVNAILLPITRICLCAGGGSSLTCYDSKRNGSTPRWCSAFATWMMTCSLQLLDVWSFGNIIYGQNLGKTP